MKKILVVLGLIIIGVLIYASTLPAHYEYAREIEISASAEKIFPFINNSEKGQSWMPWKEKDLKMQLIYTGPTEGVGSKSAWISEGEMGKGESEITESNLNKSVKMKLTYFEPMSMTQSADLNLSPTATGTLVRWSISGENNFMGRVFSVFMDMKTLIGKEFDKGLNKLKLIVEASEQR